jgi:hypothetical protein
LDFLDDLFGSSFNFSISTGGSIIFGASYGGDFAHTKVASSSLSLSRSIARLGNHRRYLKINQALGSVKKKKLLFFYPSFQFCAGWWRCWFWLGSVNITME